MKATAAPFDEDVIHTLSAALRIRLAHGASLVTTVAAYVLRSLAARTGPCDRRELLRQASGALDGLTTIDRVVLKGSFEDLVAVGDLVELPAMMAERTECPTLVFCTQPSFLAMQNRIYLVGAAHDEAPCLPRTITEALWSDGSSRYLDVDESQVSGEDLRRMGLTELDGERWRASPWTGSPQALIDRVQAVVSARAIEGRPIDTQWLQAPTAARTYRSRWTTTADGAPGLQVARAPQLYGAFSWLVVHRSPSGAERHIYLPTEDIPGPRGCDAAWRVQLAMDHLRDTPARYRIGSHSEGLVVTVDFPLPLHERRRIRLLGGRLDPINPFRFLIPPTSESVIRQLLEEAWLSPG